MLPLTLAAAQGEEKAFAPEGAGFTILFPGAPTEHKQRVETPAGTGRGPAGPLLRRGSGRARAHARRSQPAHRPDAVRGLAQSLQRRVMSFAKHLPSERL